MARTICCYYLLILSMGVVILDAENCLAKPILCVGNNATLKCLKENGNELYASDYNRFWDIIYKAESKALLSDKTSMVEFIELANIMRNNVEFSEYLSEAIPKIFLKKSTLFMDSLLVADDKTLGAAIAILKAPMGNDKCNGDDIKQQMRKFRKTKKYKRILEMYYSS